MKEYNNKLKSLSEDLAIKIIQKYLISKDDMAMAKYLNSMTELIYNHLYKFDDSKSSK